ncbi:hypothetical protein HGRIS_000987 [Hohenbuehelia grisea]|uniref:Uncharacterized protein n=1 Tax=Hohenbuehelia grisea TaxID=104357 RepID=A0ABR3IQE8_9AGAR
MLLVPSIFLSLLLLPPQCLYSAFALKNITIDDNSPQITYFGQWIDSSPTDLNLGGSHKYSVDRVNGRATFTFTGVAVYYMASLWAYPVSSQVTLDGALPVHIGLTAPPSSAPIGSEAAPAEVRWSATSLSNTQHTLVVSVASDTGFAIVDGFIITVEDDAPSQTAASGSSLTAATSSAQVLSKTRASIFSSSVSAAPDLQSISSTPSSAIPGTSSTSSSSTTLPQSPQSNFALPSASTTSFSPSNDNLDTTKQHGPGTVVIVLAILLPTIIIGLALLGCWMARRYRPLPSLTDEEQKLSPTLESPRPPSDARIPVPFTLYSPMDSNGRRRANADKPFIFPPSTDSVDETHAVVESSLSNPAQSNSVSSHSATERHSFDSGLSYYLRALESAEPPRYEE